MCPVNCVIVTQYGYKSCRTLLPVHLRIDTGKYDHITPALNILGWLTIEEQLPYERGTMYKCVKTVNNLVLAYLSKLGKRSDAHAYNLRNNDHPNIAKCRTVAAQHGFLYRVTKAWNNLSR